MGRDQAKRSALQAIFLEAAVGFVRNGSFDEAGFQSRVEVVFTKGGAMGETEGFHAVCCAERSVFQDLEEFFDLVAHLVADLVALQVTFEGIKQSGEGKLDKGRGVGDFVTSRQGVVVFLLPFANDFFDREVGQGGFPVAQDQGLPKAPHPPVAIAEGVDEFQFIMEDAAGHKRMGVGRCQPAKKVTHESGDIGGRGSEMD